MIQRIHSTRTLLVLLIVAMTVTTGAGAAELAYAVTKGATELAPDKKRANEILLQQTNNDEIRKKLRKQNDEKSKVREPLYPRQAGSLAKHYRETAAIVARQGGDPKPLLEASAYFESQSK